MTKKHLLFALIVCMSTVWRFLELLEYGEIEVRQVDTYRPFCHPSGWHGAQGQAGSGRCPHR